MSAYLHGYDSDGCDPHARFPPPISPGPLTAYDLDDDDFSLEFDAEERATDAAVKPRLPHEQSRVAARVSPPPSPPAPCTISQRMLQSLQQHRAQNRAAAAASLLPRKCTSRAVERALGNSMFELGSVVKTKTSHASTVRRTDAAFDTPLSSRPRSSCTDRLEARISKSFLAQRGNGPGRRAAGGKQDVSLLYSGRETFPSESVRKIAHARLSDNRSDNASTPQETRMMEIMDKERASRVFRPQMSCPEISLGDTKKNGVMFHFRRGSSVKNDAIDGRMEQLALTNGRADASAENALVKAQYMKRVTDPEYTALASQLAETESLVDSIESCMKKLSFSELTACVLKEMQLLLKTTQEIRTNGTTLLLANVGKHQKTVFTEALRRLVARAALVQKRIGALMAAIKQLVV